MKSSNKVDSKRLYFMAIRPPAELSGQIRAIQQDIAERFNSKKALGPPVHITMLPPLEAGEWLEKLFNEKLPSFFQNYHQFRHSRISVSKEPTQTNPGLRFYDALAPTVI